MVTSPKMQASQAKQTQESTIDQFDFKKWNMGNGKIAEKRGKLMEFLTYLMDRNNSKTKKDHDKYCKMIKMKRNKGLSAFNAYEKNMNNILVSPDKTDPLLMEETHSNMITTVPNQIDMEDTEIIFDNDFIGKNKNMLSFYKEHDTEKRVAFSKLRDYFT